MPPVDRSSVRYMGIRLALILQYVTEMCIKYANWQLLSNLSGNSRNTNLPVFTMAKDFGCWTILSEILGKLLVLPTFIPSHPSENLSTYSANVLFWIRSLMSYHKNLITTQCLLTVKQKGTSDKITPWKYNKDWERLEGKTYVNLPINNEVGIIN
jgi:hypothetical protein